MWSVLYFLFIYGLILLFMTDIVTAQIMGEVLIWSILAEGSFTGAQ